ncbi:MAG: potassium channel protein [Flavobacteriales bacterium]|nr:potassium channel protein [Flavobacteriales bacterium]
MRDLSRFKNIIFSFLFLFLILIIGVIGFKSLEPRYTLLEAVYMTVITITTIGFREIYEPTSGTMIFISLLIVTSFGTFAYAVSAISAYIIDGEFREYFKEYKVKSEVSKLKNHVIICGYGRNGSQAVTVLKKHKQPFLVVENNPTAIEEIKKHNPELLLVVGDATHDEVLEEAGIQTAQALITTLPSDSNNLFVVLSARSVNSSIKIISRASEDNSDKKLRIAGANNVIMPDKIGGAHMASLVMKPDIIEFMDYISAQSNIDINLEELSFDVLPERFRGKSITEIGIRQLTGANIIGLKRDDGAFEINPNPETLITSKIKVFVLGTPNQIKKLNELFQV